MIAPGLMPAWMGRVARFSPVDWAAVASREALGAAPDGGVVPGRGGLLLARAIVLGWLNTRAYRACQRAG